MSDKKVIVPFTALTFCIAYGVSSVLIVLGQFGYRVYGLGGSLQQFAMNIPFAIYILSPAIASFVVLRKNGEVASLREWIKTVSYWKNNGFVYLVVVAGVALYFGIHMAVAAGTDKMLPFYMFFLSLPGNFFIGGLEETGWMYVLQPGLDKRYGFLVSSIFVGVIWIFWHIPLFFIPGTNHCDGLIDFWMFNIQVMSLSFFRGAIYKIAGKGYVFMYVLFHTMFNAMSSLFVSRMTWAGTIVANIAMILFSIAIVTMHRKSKTKDG